MLTHLASDKKQLHIFELTCSQKWLGKYRQIITSQIWSNLNFWGPLHLEFSILQRDPFDSPISSGDFNHWGHHENEKLAKYPACWRVLSPRNQNGMRLTKHGACVFGVSHIVPYCPIQKKNVVKQAKLRFNRVLRVDFGITHGQAAKLISWDPCDIAHHIWCPRGVHHHFYGDFNLP